MEFETDTRLEKMKLLREQLDAVEADREAGCVGYTIEELDQILAALLED